MIGPINPFNRNPTLEFVPSMKLIGNLLQALSVQSKLHSNAMYFNGNGVALSNVILVHEKMNVCYISILNHDIHK